MVAQVLSTPSVYLSRPSDARQNPNKWAVLRQRLKCPCRYSCLFADNRRQEQARKALESALGEKKPEFEKWNKEILKREEAAGGGNGRGGGWFGGGGFGWFRDEHFWKEAQAASLAIMGILLAYLLITNGQVMLAVIFNSLLFVLRGPRNGLSLIASRLSGKKAALEPSSSLNMEDAPKMSAKERVLRKWGMD